MRKLPILLFASAMLVVGMLAVRVVYLEHRLEAAERQQSASSPTSTGKSSVRAPVSPPTDPVETPDPGLAAELADARAELAGLKQQITTAQQQAESSRRAISGITGAHIIESNSASNVPFRGVIEHWTGGEKRRWGHEQAAGAPDTSQAGDVPSAWASKSPDGGEEWLQLDYDRFVDLQQINIVESHNPGAISKVVALLSNGREATIWEGSMEASSSDELVSSAFPVAESLRARSVKVYLDTSRVPGWNEIDAVEIMGRDGSKQWASSSRASSSYADP